MEQKFRVFEQQIMQIQEQLGAIEQALVDMTSISTGLDELVGKKDQEIMAVLGRGIYVKAKLVAEELTVDVGGKNFVEKSIPETKKLIDDQIEKIKEIKKSLEGELNKINEELTKTMLGAQGQGCACEEKGECDNACADDCKCE